MIVDAIGVQRAREPVRATRTAVTAAVRRSLRAVLHAVAAAAGIAAATRLAKVALALVILAARRADRTEPAARAAVHVDLGAIEHTVATARRLAAASHAGRATRGAAAAALTIPGGLAGSARRAGRAAAAAVAIAFILIDHAVRAGRHDRGRHYRLHRRPRRLCGHGRALRARARAWRRRSVRGGPGIGQHDLARAAAAGRAGTPIFAATLARIAATRGQQRLLLLRRLIFGCRQQASAGQCQESDSRQHDPAAYQIPRPGSQGSAGALTSRRPA